MPHYSLLNGVYVARFTQEEIQSGGCEDIEACLEQVLSDLPPDVRAILFDLEGIRFLRSSGLGAVLDLCERLKPKGVQLAVCHVPAFGRNLFKISKLDEHLLVFPSVDAGVDALGWGDAEGDVPS